MWKDTGMETITEKQADTLARLEVHAAKGRDATYRNGATRADKNAREDQIASEVWDSITQRYMVTG